MTRFAFEPRYSGAHRLIFECAITVTRSGMARLRLLAASCNGWFPICNQTPSNLRSPFAHPMRSYNLKSGARMRTLIVAPLLVLAGAVQASASDTYIFRDTLQPRGHYRSMAAKRADGRKCGSTSQNTFSHAAAFEQCMKARGWVLDHIVPDQSGRCIDP